MYAIKRECGSPLELEDYEKITKITPGYILIKADYLNEFNFMQRLLSFGDNLVYIEDEELLNRVRNLIKEVAEMYG